MGAKDIRDAIKIGRGALHCNRVMRGGHQLWPSAYVGVLVATWVCAGQYTLAAIPASGGSATPTWVFKVFRTGETTTPVYQANVSPTVVCEELFGESWLTAQHFHYTGGVWSADDRARNGLNDSSGTSAPQSAPARYSRLSASYSYTFNGVRVSASAQVQMTQNPNNVRSVSSTYSNLRVSLSKYYSSASPAPAYSTSDARVSALMDAATLYQFYDGVTNVNGLTYTYNQADAVTSERFNFSCSWCSFSNHTSSGANVIVESREKNYDPYGRSANIRATFTGDTTKYADVTIYQAMNILGPEVEVSNTTTGWYIELLDANGNFVTTGFPKEGGDVYVHGVKVYTHRAKRYYSSSTQDDPQYESIYETGQESGISKYDLENVYATDGSTTINATSYNKLAIPANGTTSDREFDVYASWDGWPQSANASFTQSGVTITYGIPRVTLGYDTIGAAALTGYPTVSIEQDVYNGGTFLCTMSGSISGGATSGTIRDDNNTMSADFSVSYSGSAVSGTGASFNSADGGVTTATRGVTIGDIRVVANNIIATVSMDNGQSGSNSQAQSVSQAANQLERTEPIAYSSCRISAISPSGTPGCSPVTIGVTVLASGTDEKYIYTSYDDGDTQTGYSGGEPFTDRSVTADTLYYRKGSSGSYSSASDTNSFTADNRYNTSAVTWFIKAQKGDATSSEVTKGQGADTQSDWIYGDYAVTISVGSGITAAGGTASVSAVGTRSRYRAWTDGTPVSGTVSTGLPYAPSLSLDGAGSSIFWLSDESSDSSTGVTTATLNHRDMENNETTDSVTVVATAGDASDSGSASATNSKSYGTITFTVDTTYIGAGQNTRYYIVSCPIIWTSGYPGDSLSAADFTFSFDQKGNNGKRSYTIESGVDSQGRKLITYGSLGTNEVTELKDTVVKASHSGAGNKTRTMTERMNNKTESLQVNWNITGSPISGLGGTATVRVTSASRVATYDSGASGTPTTVPPLSVISALQISGTGFSMTKSYMGTPYATVTAGENPSYSDGRSAELSATINGLTATTEVEQEARFYRVEYTPSGGVITARLYNTDTANSHSYTFTRIRVIGGVRQPDETGSATIAANGSQIVGQLNEGAGNNLSITDISYT